MSLEVLTLCGSLRAKSTNDAVLRTVETLLPDGVTAVRYTGMRELPHFDPDDDHEPLPPAVADLRSRIEAADALLICTPEYAGALPGAFKNLLDWTVGGMEICEKPTGWINASPRLSPEGGARAHESLRAVLTFTGARIIDEACGRAVVTQDAVGADGIITDPQIRATIREVVGALVERTRHLRVAEGPQTPTLRHPLRAS